MNYIIDKMWRLKRWESIAQDFHKFQLKTKADTCLKATKLNTDPILYSSAPYISMYWKSPSAAEVSHTKHEAAQQVREE